VGKCNTINDDNDDDDDDDDNNNNNNNNSSYEVLISFFGYCFHCR
jgi:hypothetical protein